jgi:hypothetical protein
MEEEAGWVAWAELGRLRGVGRDWSGPDSRRIGLHIGFHNLILRCDIFSLVPTVSVTPYTHILAMDFDLGMLDGQALSPHWLLD